MDGGVRLCDFGLAINLTTDTPVGRVGTHEYMSPEISRLPFRRPAAVLEARALPHRADHNIGLHPGPSPRPSP